MYIYICRWIVDRNSTDNGSHLNGSRSSLITKINEGSNQRIKWPECCPQHQMKYLSQSVPNVEKKDESSLSRSTANPMASRKTIFPGLAELGLEPRVKRHMENVLSPDRKQSKVYAAAASYKTHTGLFSMFDCFTHVTPYFRFEFCLRVISSS